MGADLIGYMVAGPVELDPSKESKAIEKGLSILGLIERINVELETANEEDSSGTKRDDVVANWRHAGMKGEIPDWIDEALSFGEVSEIHIPGPGTVAAFVSDFMDFWLNPHGRDVADRIVVVGEEKRRVIFAGEMSWGDEPDGTGYRMLDAAKKLGLFEVFGIE